MNISGGKGKDVTEKRRFERFNVTLDTRYTKSQGHTTISSLTNTKDISRNGLCSTLSRVVQLKDTILIEISLADKVRIAALAKVLWLRPDPDSRSNICGLRFLWISSRAVLNESIENIKGIQAA